MSKKNNEYNIVIDPERAQKEYFKDIKRYRELFYFFAWRDLVVRYKETFLGLVWALFRPLINMAVFVLIFGKIAKLASPDVNYPLFVLSGLLPWQLFTSSFIDSSASLLQNAHLISKVYFPRIILPITSIVVSLSDFLISFVLLFSIFGILGEFRHWTILYVPLFIVMTLVLCLGVSFWLSALSARFRDLRFIVPFIVQFGMFISPIGYSSSLVQESWRWVYFLNPMAGIIEGFHWCCLGIYEPFLPLAIGISLVINIFLLITGFLYFRKMESRFADIM